MKNLIKSGTAVDALALHIHFMLGMGAFILDTKCVHPKTPAGLSAFYSSHFRRKYSWALRHIRVYLFLNKYPILFNVPKLTFTALHANITNITNLMIFNPTTRALFTQASSPLGLAVGDVLVGRGPQSSIAELTAEMNEYFTPAQTAVANSADD